MVTRVAVSRLRKSLVFLFLMTITRKSRFSTRAAKARAAQPIHHQVGLEMTEIWRRNKGERKQEHCSLELLSLLPDYPAEGLP